MNRKLEYVITYQLHVYRQIMITFGWYLLVKAVQETCKANFYVKNVVPVYTQGVGRRLDPAAQFLPLLPQSMLS